MHSYTVVRSEFPSILQPLMNLHMSQLTNRLTNVSVLKRKLVCMQFAGEYGHSHYVHLSTLAATIEGTLVSPGVNIAEVLIADGRFTKLVEFVVEAGLVDAISGEEALTVFAPTDDAFEALLKPDGKEEDIVIEPDVLKDVLLYHVAGLVVELEDGKTIEMLNGDTVLLTVTKVNDSNIEDTLYASNGVIYVS